tara:strand:+ start:677 stop:1384 length:708 start_codon:yes stop_codon:yes gene_type:complete
MTESNNNKTTTSKLQEIIDGLKCYELTGNSKIKCSSIETELTSLRDEYIGTDLNEYADSINRANYDTKHNLADKKTSIGIFTKENQNLRQHIDNIKQEKLNKQRVVEASEWEYDRYNSHLYIFKIIFFSLVIVNIILFARSKIPIIPDTITFGLIILIVAVMIFTVSIEIMYNMRRNRFDYDKFDQSYDQRFNSNSDMGKLPKETSSSLLKNLLCESFENRKENTLNGHHYSFIN